MPPRKIEKRKKNMIIAIIVNIYTHEIIEMPVPSCKDAEKIVTDLNEHRPDLGFFMIMDYEADDLDF